MRAALVVNESSRDSAANLRRMIRSAGEAADAGCQLALFAEAAPSGLRNHDDPAYDLSLGQPIPGPATDALGAVARARRLYVAFGLFEREGDALYDSAVLLDPAGEMALRYRRIHPGWHGLDVDPSVYREGTELPAADTPLGRVGFLICGDLFDDPLVRRAGALELDYVLFPFARSFDDGSFDQARWDREEEPEYVSRAARTRATVLMVNELDDPATSGNPSFGGAWVVSPAGTIRSRWPLGTPGVLFAAP